MYYFPTTNTIGISHSVAGILIGDNPLNFVDWLFFNYYSNDPFKPGDFDMDANHPMTMALEAYVKNKYTGNKSFTLVDNIINFDLNNGVATLNKYNPELLTIKNPTIIKVHIGGLEKLIVDNNGLPSDQNYTPEFLKSKGYNSIPDTTKENTALPINLTYKDRDITRFLGNHYKFFRDFIASIYSGGVTKSDSTTQEIEIYNLTPVDQTQNSTPKQFKLDGNYPNPFNPSTTIRYEFPKPGEVKFVIYDVSGRELFKFTETNISAGTHTVNIDLSAYSSGVYLLRASQNSQSQTIKLNFIK